MEALNIDTCLATFQTEENQRALKSSTELAAMNIPVKDSEVRLEPTDVSIL